MYMLCKTDLGYIIYDRGALMLSDIDSNWGKFRTFTSMFLHADMNHLTSNMFMLILLGGVIENYTGHVFFLFMYLMSGLFGNFFSLGYEQFFGISRISVGASGAIMGNVGFLAWQVDSYPLCHQGSPLSRIFALISPFFPLCGDLPGELL